MDDVTGMTGPLRARITRRHKGEESHLIAMASNSLPGTKRLKEEMGAEVRRWLFPWTRLSRRGKILTGVGVVVILIIAAVAGGSGNKHNSDVATASNSNVTTVTQSSSIPSTQSNPTTVSVAPSTSPPTVATTVPTTVPPTTTPPPPPNSDKGWAVVANSLLTKNDGTGDFGGSARITNKASDFENASFTFTLFRGSVQIATLQGSAQGVSPGQTVTVKLISQNPYSAGAYTFTFQTDTSYASGNSYSPATSTSDKGWSVVAGSLLTHDDGTGDFGGTVRLTNTNTSSMSASFSFTLFRGSTQIAILEGSAQGASPNQTVTVQLISQDPYSAGSYTWFFQADTSFSG